VAAWPAAWASYGIWQCEMRPTSQRYHMLGRKAKTMTPAQMKQFLNDIKVYRVEGKGKIDDVVEVSSKFV
jgi:hypothetical protein